MVSVCIATFNGAEFIKEQLDSILSQIKEDDEIVVSDDGSTDDTVKIIESYNDGRIKVLRHQKIRTKYSFDYTTHNFENAIINCRGDQVMLSDQDDVWLPEKYELTLAKLKEYDIVLSDCKIVDKELKVKKESKFDGSNINPRIINNLIKNKHIGCCMAFNRSVISIVLPFPKYGVAQDFWIAVYGGLFFRVGYINHPLILYRRHEGNVSETGKKSNNSVGVKIGYRFYMIKALLRRAGINRIILNL